MIKIFFQVFLLFVVPAYSLPYSRNYVHTPSEWRSVRSTTKPPSTFQKPEFIIPEERKRVNFGFYNKKSPQTPALEQPALLEPETSAELRRELSQHGFTGVIVDEAGRDGEFHIKQVLFKHNKDESIKVN